MKHLILATLLSSIFYTQAMNNQSSAAEQQTNDRQQERAILQETSAIATELNRLQLQEIEIGTHSTEEQECIIARLSQLRNQLIETQLKIAKK